MDRASSPYPLRSGGAVGPAASAAASQKAAMAKAAAVRVSVEARLAHAGPIPTPQSILPYRHALVLNEYDVIKVVEGQYPHKKIHVVQWAIRDGRVLPDARKIPGRAVGLTVEPYDVHPELEGERLITDLGVSDLPLFYEIER
jgi:hypothetical protein